jgi:Predicted metal-dependent phosphoesterases (PHP family)
MSFQFDNVNLFDYDIYPKVIPAGKEAAVTIRPLGAREQFHPGQSYQVVVKAISGGKPEYFPVASEFREYQALCGPDGALRFDCILTREQQYFVDVYYVNHRGQNAQERFSVYCVEGELAGRYPFIGDLHTHSCRSDGNQKPETVCANYRRWGYDFIALTDHRRYYPSLHAMRAISALPTEMTVLPGEEVHLPKAFGQFIDPHIINIGGEYSVNAMIARDDVPDASLEPSERSLYGACPPVMDQAQYEEAILKTMEGLDIPEGLDRVPAAGVKWAYDEIRRAGGLAIWPHPTWVHDVFHNPDLLQDFMVDNKVFDAFEVLGGENYFEQNGYQTVRYYEDRARGHNYPVVGSTDSHSSNPNNRNGLICSTIIFAPACERKALMDAVKGYYSVAVDTISKEFRLVGEMRLVRYGCFLLKNYFPIHDEAVAEEGRLLKQYFTGTEEEKADALSALAAMSGRVKKLLKKYFAF